MKFNYSVLPRDESDGTRKYISPTGEKLPSVTTIIKATQSKRDRQVLANWRKRVGDKEASRITQEAASVGGLMHKSLENKINGKEEIIGDNLIHRISKKMSNSIYENIESHISEIWGSEVRLYYPELYAGTADLIGVWKDRPAIMDFKQANKPKKKEWIADYFCQGVLYSEAHNVVYGTDIKSVAIFVCVRNSDYDFQLFEIVDDEYEHYKKIAGERVAEYYNINLAIS